MNNPLTFIPPPLKKIQQGLWLQNQWFDPVFSGLDNVDSADNCLESCVLLYGHM